MNGDYIKIISDGTQLFEKDTECFLFDKKTNTYIRPTLDQFYDMVLNEPADFIGLHKCDTDHESKVRNIPLGTIFYDLEWCGLDEFYFVHCNESKVVNREGKEIV